MSLDDLQPLLETIENHSATAWLTLAGLILCFFALRNGKDKDKKGESKWRNPWFVAAGVALIVAAQSASFINLKLERRTSPKQAFANLKINARVTWLIRLVPYDPGTEPGLAVGSGYGPTGPPQLKRLGKEGEEFVFVADYFELRNYTVAEAIYKVGGSLETGKHVSAIVFPLSSSSNRFFPANNRGLLQVIEILDKKNRGTRDYCAFGYLNSLNDDEKKDLDWDGDADARKIDSYAWERYRRYYDDYDRAVRNFRQGSETCSGDHRYSAERLIGKVASDWSPLGYSQFEPGSGQQGPAFTLYKPDGGRVPLPDFGVRAFLIENLEIAKIPGRVMIDFDQPSRERIPDLTGKLGTSVGLGD